MACTRSLRRSLCTRRPVWLGLPWADGAASASAMTLPVLFGGGLLDGFPHAAVPRLRSEKTETERTVVKEGLLGCTTTEVARSSSPGQEGIAFLGAQQSTDGNPGRVSIPSRALAPVGKAHFRQRDL